MRALRGGGGGGGSGEGRGEKGEVAYALCGETKWGGRLPAEVCSRIERIAEPVLWRACDGCGSPLLRLSVQSPFVQRLPTEWVFDGKEWLLTDRGAMRREEPSPSSYSSSASLPDLVLEGESGTCTPSCRRPRTVRVGGATFRNRVVQFDQCQWYKVMGDRFLCRCCIVTSFRLRAHFYAWCRRGRSFHVH